MNKREAVEEFVKRDFNFIPLSLVEKAYKDEGLYDYILQPNEPQLEDFGLEEEPEFWDDEPTFDEQMPTRPLRREFDDDEDYEVAMSDYEDELSEYDDNLNQFQEDLKEYNEAKKSYEDALRRYEEYQSAYEDWEYKTSDYYPMWGTLFECNDSWLGDTILEHKNEVEDIGFIILDGFDELNVCLGVAGAGYSFHDAHWTPLYDLLGYKWHDER